MISPKINQNSYQLTQPLKQLLYKNAYSDIFVYLKHKEEVSWDEQKMIYEHLSNTENVINHEQSIDVEPILDILIILFERNQEQQFDYSGLLSNILKDYIDHGESKYIFMFYQLKFHQLTDQFQKFKWLSASSNFLPYFANIGNPSLAKDYQNVLVDYKNLYNKLTQQSIQLGLPPEQMHHKLEVIKKQMLSFIQNFLEYISNFCLQDWFKNELLVGFLGKIQIPDFYFIQKQSPLYHRIQSILGKIPNNILYDPQLVISLPSIISINIIRMVHFPIYNHNSNKTIFYLTKIIKLILPESAIGQHPFQSCSQPSDKQVKNIIRLFCEVFTEQQFWDDPQILMNFNEKQVLIDLMETLRSLVIYMGFLSPVNDKQLYALIKNTIIDDSQGSLVNQLLFWKYCLKEARNRKQLLEYRIFLFNNYRMKFIHTRNLKNKSTRYSYIIKVTQKVLKKQIQLAKQFTDTNHIGYIISFIMNYLTILSSPTVKQFLKLTQIYNFMDVILNETKKLKEVLAQKNNNSKNQNQQDQVDLCLLRMKQLEGMYEKLKK